jgi:hypothetical protein
MKKLITYLAITSGYINCSQGGWSNRQQLTRCNSAPDLRALCNTTVYLSASGFGGAAGASLVPQLVKDNNNNNNRMIPYSKYKSLVFNRYKRNIYLRSKEKYTFAEK